MNGNGAFKVLLVFVALVTIIGGAAAYDSRVDEKIDRSHVQRDARLERIEGLLLELLKR